MSYTAVPPLENCEVIDLREIWALADKMNAVGFPEVAEALIDLGRELADGPWPQAHLGLGRSECPDGEAVVANA